MEEEIRKRYYSIGEVAEMFDVNASLIRFWEAEFPALNPKKNKKGDRQFTEKDIEILRMIYSLVREKGYTLQGAKEVMKEQAQQRSQKAAMIASLEKVKEFLTVIRNNLEQNQQPEATRGRKFPAPFYKNAPDFSIRIPT
jgi:DNA-binding transcriptional MerR regulator